jgi:FkbH-like protein
MASLMKNGKRTRLAQWLSPFYLAPCDEVGKRARTFGRPLIENLGRVRIGDDVTFDSRPEAVRITAGLDAAIDIGPGAILASGAILAVRQRLVIGKRVRIGRSAELCDYRGETCREGSESEAIEIGDDVIIEDRVVVEKGARIGPGTTVTEGSVVRGILPAGAIASGIPARVAEAPAKSLRVAVRERRRCHGVLIADSTVADLATCLGEHADGPLAITTEIAPFAQVVQTLNGLAARAERPDFAVVWTQPALAIAAFRRRLEGERIPLEEILAEVDAFAAVVAAHAAAAGFVFVPAWTAPAHSRGLGLMDLGEDGVASAIAAMNLRLVNALRPCTNAFVLDAQRWLTAASAKAFNDKLWYHAKIAFTRALFAVAAEDIAAALAGLFGYAKKLVVVDLDNTLWGGTLGDVGWENLGLGGHDGAGEAFADFQRRLLALSRRGIALAVVSKNDEATALEAIRRHPEMVLGLAHFAAHRINWQDKAANVAEIAHALNLGLGSIVFIDDNPLERGRVREALPEVFVPEWPDDPAGYVAALDRLTCFDTPRMSDEDRQRSHMYQAERERLSARAEVPSLAAWLQSLETEARFELLAADNLARAAQLLNKTNQMNLRTRRMGERDLMAWAGKEGHEVWVLHVRDRFGAAGLTGILGLAAAQGRASVEDFVLSCRVMGRGIEATLLWAAVQRARWLGCHELFAEPIATAKNKPCLDFWQSCGCTGSDENLIWPLMRDPPQQSFVTIHGIEACAPCQ